jgi:hypothetical protein
MSVKRSRCLHASPMWVFAAAAAAIVPLVDGFAAQPEQVAERAGRQWRLLKRHLRQRQPNSILALFVLRFGNTRSW